MRRGFLKELERRNVLKVAVAYLVSAWLLAQVADLLLDSFAAPAWTMRVLLIALAIGFPIALAVSWTFEVTSHGVIPESEIDRTLNISDRSGRRIDLILLLIVAIVVVFMGLERFVFSQRYHGTAVTTDPAQSSAGAESMSPSHGENVAIGSRELTPTPLPSGKSVAVLPFAVLSTGPDDDYFADGLTDEISNALSQLPELMVTARTSAFYFKGQNLPVGEIAHRLGVTHIVEGSVRRAGDQLRVTAQLVRADDGFHLWSETYDRRTEDTFAVQMDIAEQVASALNILLDADLRERMRRIGTRNIEAFITFQKGIEFYERAHQEPNQISLLRQANVHFENAVELAPDLAEAYEYHTDLYSQILISHAAGEAEGEITAADIAGAPERLAQDYERVVRFARTARQRKSAEFGRALVLGEWRGLSVLSEQAAAPPGCEAAAWLHLMGPVLGQTEFVLEVFQRVAVCDPLRVHPLAHIVGSEFWLGQAQRALDDAQQGLSRLAHPFLSRHLALALAFLGRREEAERAASSRIRAENELQLARSMLAAIRGDAEASRELESRYLSSSGPNDRETLVLAAARGERNEANRLAGAIDARPFGHMVLLQAIYACFCGAPFDLESVPVFAGLLAESGLRWPPERPFELPLKNW
jgi:TolB-like protein